MAGFDRDQLIEAVTRRELSSCGLARHGAGVADRAPHRRGVAAENDLRRVARPKATMPARSMPASSPRQWTVASASSASQAAAEAPAVGPGDSGRCLPRPIRPWSGPSEQEPSPPTGRRTAISPPHDPIGPAPLARAVEARAAWQRAYEALGRPEAQRDLAGATDAELRAVVERYRREEAWAPPHVDDADEGHVPQPRQLAIGDRDRTGRSRSATPVASPCPPR